MLVRRAGEQAGQPCSRGANPQEPPTHRAASSWRYGERASSLTPASCAMSSSFSGSRPAAARRMLTARRGVVLRKDVVLGSVWRSHRRYAASPERGTDTALHGCARPERIRLTHCLVFRPGAIADFTLAALPRDLHDRDAPQLPVCAKLAIANGVV